MSSLLKSKWVGPLGPQTSLLCGASCRCLIIACLERGVFGVPTHSRKCQQMGALISHLSNRKACSKMTHTERKECLTRSQALMPTPGLSHPYNQTGIHAPRFPEGGSLLVEIPTFTLPEQEDGGRNCFFTTQLWSQVLLEAAEEKQFLVLFTQGLYCQPINQSFWHSLVGGLWGYPTGLLYCLSSPFIILSDSSSLQNHLV